MDELLNNTLATSQPDLLGATLKTFTTLCVVLGLLILTLYLIKRFFYLRNSRSDEKLIKVIATSHLAPKVRIALIEIMGEKLVVGVSQENIRFLTKIEPPAQQAKDMVTVGGGIREP
jgi:flagellar biosynthetic protein FliO